MILKVPYTETEEKATETGKKNRKQNNYKQNMHTSLEKDLWSAGLTLKYGLSLNTTYCRSAVA